MVCGDLRCMVVAFVYTYGLCCKLCVLGCHVLAVHRCRGCCSFLEDVCAILVVHASMHQCVENDVCVCVLGWVGYGLGSQAPGAWMT